MTSFNTQKFTKIFGVFILILIIYFLLFGSLLKGIKWCHYGGFGDSNHCHWFYDRLHLH